MARISLLAEKLSHFPHRSQGPWQLAQLLAQLGHELTLITSQSEEVPVDPKINCIRPFKRWTWLEALTAAPKLVQMAPEVLIVIQPEAGNRRSHFHPADLLPVFLKALPHTSLACYLHSPVTSKESYSFLELTKNSDYLICSDSYVFQSLTPEMKNSLKGEAMIIPMDEDEWDNSPQKLIEAEAEILRSLDSQDIFLLLPYGFSRAKDLDSLFEVAQSLPEQIFVMLSPWQDLPKASSRQIWEQIQKRELQRKFFFVGGRPSSVLQKQLLDRALGLALFPYSLKLWEHDHFSKQCLFSKTPALLLNSQKVQASEQWQPELHHCIDDRYRAQSLIEWIKAPQLLREQAEEASNYLSSRDASSNLWNRLFAEDGVNG